MNIDIDVQQTVACSIDDAWGLIGPFEKMHDWFPGIAKFEYEGSGIGSVRHLTMPDGAIYSDQLSSENKYQYSYAIVGGEVPFENYLATVSVIEDQDSTQLTYHVNIDVPEEHRQASVDLLTNMYKSAFENSKEILEKS